MRCAARSVTLIADGVENGPAVGQFLNPFVERHSPMKTLVVLAALVALSCAPALAADGKVSQSSLKKMGLSGMQPMSDAKGLEIRGSFVPPDPCTVIGELEKRLPPPLARAIASAVGTHCSMMPVH